jgi:hypothetical protein
MDRILMPLPDKKLFGVFKVPERVLFDVSASTAAVWRQGLGYDRTRTSCRAKPGSAHLAQTSDEGGCFLVGWLWPRLCGPRDLSPSRTLPATLPVFSPAGPDRGLVHSTIRVPSLPCWVTNGRESLSFLVSSTESGDGKNATRAVVPGLSASFDHRRLIGGDQGPPRH